MTRSDRRGSGLLDVGRLFRYAVAGGLSAATHLGTLALLVELFAIRPVIASTIGFILSIAVSYLLQHRWVFASTIANRTALPRFLTVTAVGMALNAAVVAIGTEVLAAHYGLVQLVALVLIPLSNYLLNSLWTFRDPAPPDPARGSDPTDSERASPT